MLSPYACSASHARFPGAARARRGCMEVERRKWSRALLGPTRSGRGACRLAFANLLGARHTVHFCAHATLATKQQCGDVLSEPGNLEAGAGRDLSQHRRTSGRSHAFRAGAARGGHSGALLGRQACRRGGQFSRLHIDRRAARAAQPHRDSDRRQHRSRRRAKFARNLLCATGIGSSTSHGSDTTQSSALSAALSTPWREALRRPFRFQAGSFPRAGYQW